MKYVKKCTGLATWGRRVQYFSFEGKHCRFMNANGQVLQYSVNI